MVWGFRVLALRSRAKGLRFRMGLTAYGWDVGLKFGTRRSF